MFALDEFTGRARRDFVLVSLDFPHGEKARSDVPNPLRNAEVKARFRVGTFPTVLVMTADGDVLGEAGYREGGPKAYLAHLAALRTDGHAKLDAVQRLVEAGRVGDMLAALEAMTPKSIGRIRLAEAIKNSGSASERVARALMRVGVLDIKVQEAVLDLDPINRKGLREQYVFALVRFVDSVESVRGAVEAMKELVDEVPFVDKEQGAKMCVYVAFYWYEYLREARNARPWAARAKKLGIKDERMRRFVDELLGTGS